MEQRCLVFQSKVPVVDFRKLEFGRYLSTREPTSVQRLLRLCAPRRVAKLEVDEALAIFIDKRVRDPPNFSHSPLSLIHI